MTCFITGIGTVKSVLSVTSVLRVQSISPNVSSVYGGAILRIVGNGFSSSSNTTTVTTNSGYCHILSVSPREILCRTPVQNESSRIQSIRVNVFENQIISNSAFTYEMERTPFIVSITTYQLNDSVSMNITGMRLMSANTSVRVGRVPCMISYLTTTLIHCNSIKGIAAGYHSVIVNVHDIGDSNSNVSYYQNLSIYDLVPSEGSLGGGLSVTIRGFGFNGTNVSVTICGKICSIIGMTSNQQIQCRTPSMTNETSDRICEVVVSVDNIEQTSIFTYKNNLTATICSVSPHRGGTGGGTLITIIGTGFP